jgi:hypothetical protein
MAREAYFRDTPGLLRGNVHGRAAVKSVIRAHIGIVIPEGRIDNIVTVRIGIMRCMTDDTDLTTRPSTPGEIMGRPLDNPMYSTCEKNEKKKKDDVFNNKSSLHR